MSESQSTAPVEYRPIDGCPGYLIGNDGSVLSQWYMSGKGQASIGESSHQLRPVKGANGYCYVTLRKHRKRESLAIHVLVLTAFVGPRPDNMEACHGNGIRHDNRLENLRWDTYSGNQADKVAHGTHNRGERHYYAKLKEKDVEQILLRLKAGETKESIAQLFGVSHGAIDCIHRGTTWKHVRREEVAKETAKEAKE